MEVDRQRPDLVRCLACGAVYEKPLDPSRISEGTKCPECGDLGWLAVSIPVEETATALASQ